MVKNDITPAPIRDARRLLDVAGVAVAVIDREGLTLSVSESFAEALGTSPEDAVGRHLIDLAATADRAAVLAGLAGLQDHAAQHQPAHINMHGLHANDAQASSGRLVLGTVGEDQPLDSPLLAVLTVDQPAATVQPTLLHPPGIDPLTGLGDALRRDDALAAAISRSRRTGTAVALLQCRPRVAGEPFRSELPMRDIGDRLVGELRGTDQVARVGGDFFVIAEHLGDEQDAAGVAYRLMSSLMDTIGQDNDQLRVTLTVGIAVADGVASPRVMLTAAGDALDDARADGFGGFRIVDLRAGRAA